MPELPDVTIYVERVQANWPRTLEELESMLPAMPAATATQHPRRHQR